MRLNAKTKLLLIQMLWGAGKIMRPSFRKLDEGFEAWAYRNGLLKEIYRLEAAGFLESRPGPYDADRVHRLTNAGRLAALGGRDPQAGWKRDWDGKWRLILFDIPEAERSDRRKLTRALAASGCGCLQGSVWISPYPPMGIEKQMGGNGGDCSHLIMLEADSRGLEVDRHMVAAGWNLEKINSLYERYLETLDRFPSSHTGISPEALLQWGEKENEAWLAAIRLDPLLPSRLLPKAYLGKKAWRERKKVLLRAGRVAAEALGESE